MLHLYSNMKRNYTTKNILVEYFLGVGSYFFRLPKFSDTFLIFQKKDILRGTDAIILWF